MNLLHGIPNRWSPALALAVSFLIIAGARGADVPVRLVIPQTFPDQAGVAPPADPATVATPRSDVALVARSLARFPAGRRTLVISGIGALLLRHPSDAATPRGVISAAQVGRSSLLQVAGTPNSDPVRGPWTVGGEHAVGSWVDSLLSGLAARGVGIDALVIDCEEHLRASAILRSPDRARVIESDRRWPRFASGSRLSLSLSNLMGDRNYRRLWDQAAFKWERGAIDRAVTARLARTHPAASVHYVVRHPAIGPTAVSNRGAESLYGIGRATGSDPVELLAAGLDAIGRQAAMTGLSQSPWLAPPPASVISRSYWDELVLHCAMRSGGSVLVSASDLLGADRARAALSSLAASVGHGAASWKSVDSPRADRTGAIIAASSIESNGTTFWRLSVSPTMDRSIAAAFTFEDGGGELALSLDPGAAGAWFQHPSSRRLVLDSRGIPVVSQFSAPTQACRPLLINASPMREADYANHGLSRYVIIYQDVQPGSRGTVGIDVNRVVAAARAELAKTPASWGVLDWEDPHFGIINAGPSHPKYEEAVSSICSAIAALKREFPSVRWTIWGGFEMPFWKDGGNWSNFTQPVRSELVAESVSNWSPVFGQCDWIMPWTYDIYDETMVASWFKTTLPVAAAQWSAAKVAAAREYLRRSSRSIPVVVCLCPFFVGGGTARPYSAILEDQIARDQVEPAVRSGADGIAIWTPCDWWVQVLQVQATAQMPSGQAALLGVRGDIEAAVGVMDWNAASSASAAIQRLEDIIGGMARVCRERLAAGQLASRIVP